MEKGGVQIPSNAKKIGYKRSKTNRFKFEEVYELDGKQYTEQELIDNKLAYRFVQIDKFTRIEIK